jgi:hypothetical protein
VTLRLFQSPPDVFFLFAGIMIHDHYLSLFFSFFSPLFYEATHYKSSFFPLLLAKLFFKKTCFFFYFEKTEK